MEEFAGMEVSLPLSVMDIVDINSSCGTGDLEIIIAESWIYSVW